MTDEFYIDDVDETSLDSENKSVPDKLPVIAMSGGTVIYPYMPPVPPFMPAYIQFSGVQAVAAVQAAMLTEERLVCLFQCSDIDDPTLESMSSVGTLLNIVKYKREEEGALAFVQGRARVRLLGLEEHEEYLLGQIEPVEEDEGVDVDVEALMRNALNLFRRVVKLSDNMQEELFSIASEIETPGRLADYIAAVTDFKQEDKQALLAATEPKGRLESLNSLLNHELNVLELGNKIQTDAQAEISKGQREYFLREQLKAIQKELGEGDDQAAEVDDFGQRIKDAQMPEIAEKAAMKELNRLERMNPAAAEYTVSRTYLDWLVTLPWQKSTDDSLDIKQAHEILEEDHYDLVKVKDRILEYLSVRKLKPDMKGPILCFVGPPGVGKTSLGRSIARALGRKFVRIALGGVRDEAEIRGHRRTYVGALPGRIIQQIRQSESNNPVFMLDEVDKLGADFRGDPAAALLEVLDPEQNHTFSDHYLDVPFDLSKVMFITTANLLDPVPPALRDRMEVLELPGYTAEEKLSIARQYLIPRQLEQNGIDESHISFDDAAVMKVIREYTREAGVRNLERELGTICRKVARRVAEGSEEAVQVDTEMIPEFLGPLKYYSEVAERDGEVGVCTGLSWTAFGGEILFIEATAMAGEGKLTLTGQLGDVMKESAQAALSYIRSHADEYSIPASFFSSNDLHIHVPAGAIPKDGPSAGITILTAITSLALKKGVKSGLGMTGEITLRGRVLPIGGLKEKLLAAKRAGLKTVIIPKRNEKDLTEVPEEVKKELGFICVDSAEDVLKSSLGL